jgi:hypothetical protein
MSSKETDTADRRERERFIDQALAESRRGRDRLRDRAEVQVESAHGDQPTPNVGGRR